MLSLSTSRHLYRGSLHGNEYHIWHSRHQFQPVATISGSPTRPHFCGSIIIPGVESRLMGQCRFTVPPGMRFIARSFSGGHGARTRQLVHPGYPSGCTYSIVKVQEGFLPLTFPLIKLQVSNEKIEKFFMFVQHTLIVIDRFG